MACPPQSELLHRVGFMTEVILLKRGLTHCWNPCNIQPKELAGSDSSSSMSLKALSSANCYGKQDVEDCASPLGRHRSHSKYVIGNLAVYRGSLIHSGA